MASAQFVVVMATGLRHVGVVALRVRDWLVRVDLRVVVCVAVATLRVYLLSVDESLRPRYLGARLGCPECTKAGVSARARRWRRLRSLFVVARSMFSSARPERCRAACQVPGRVVAFAPQVILRFSARPAAAYLRDGYCMVSLV